MWKCDYCSVEFEDSVRRDRNFISVNDPVENVCLRCKWYKIEQVVYGGSDMLGMMLISCPECANVPCDGHEQDVARQSAFEFLKKKRREKGIPHSQQVSDEEDRETEAYKSSLFEKYAQERSKKNGAFQERKRWWERMQDEAFDAYDRAYEEEREAKRKKDRKEMMDGEKNIATGTFTGRTRECKDCGKKFPWQARKVQCLECFKKSKSSSSTKKNKTRNCQDCGDTIDANEPAWKLRCMDCWRKNKSTGGSATKQSPSSNNNSQSRKCLDCSATIDANAPKNKVRCYSCWKKRNGR